MASGVLGTRRTERFWFCTRQSFPHSLQTPCEFCSVLPFLQELQP